MSSWLNYLNAIDVGGGATPLSSSGIVNGGGVGGSGSSPATSPPNGLAGVSPTSQPGFLSDELRAQLEAWTTVNFDDVSNNLEVPLFGGSSSLSTNVDPGAASRIAAAATPAAPAGIDGGAAGIALGAGGGSGGDGGAAAAGSQQLHFTETITNKPDPSPYSKRPFGHFQNNHHQPSSFNIATGSSSHLPFNNQLAFNAFAGGAIPSSQSSSNGNGSSNTNNHHQQQQLDNNSTNNNMFMSSKLFDFGGIPTFGAVDGSNTLFATPASPAVIPSPATTNATFAGTLAPANTPAALLKEDTKVTDEEQQPSNKKRRTASSSIASTPALSSSTADDSHDATRASTPAASSSLSTLAAKTSTPSSTTTSSSTSNKNIPLTKAAILAAQAAELAAQKVTTEEEEAARQAELNRIAAEDDKRRRNTAASARFRVKKKQREAALEDTVKELNGKIERLEKELESTKNENNFLRDLVIKKIGGGGFPSPPSASASSSSTAHVNKNAARSEEGTGLLDLPIISQPLEMLDGGRSNGSHSGKISGGLNGATGMGTFA